MLNLLKMAVTGGARNTIFQKNGIPLFAISS